MDRLGNLSNSIYKRSVLKNISKSKDLVFTPGAAAYRDAALVGDRLLSKGSGSFSLEEAINKVIASGGHPISIDFLILLPKSADETEVKELVKSLDKKILDKNIILSGLTCKTLDCINEIFIEASCLGKVERDIFLPMNVKDKLSIIMVNPLGMAGVKLLIEKKREELINKYTSKLVENAYKCLETNDFNIEETMSRLNLIGAKALGESGILGGLWDIAESMKKGLEIDSGKMVISQDIIEVCEMYGINPYILNSTGSFLFISNNGERDLEVLKGLNIKANIIGEMTENNNKILRNKDMIRFIDKPVTDEVYRLSSL